LCFLNEIARNMMSELGDCDILLQNCQQVKQDMEKY
jgi:hypothetical protein